MLHLDHEISREQISMIALEERVSKDAYVWLVDDFVEMLPIDQLGITHA